MTYIKGINENTISIESYGEKELITIPFPFLGIKVHFDDSASIHAYYTHEQWVIYLVHRGYEHGTVHFCTIDGTTDIYSTTATPTEVTILHMNGIEHHMKLEF